ncbi:MAG: tetratricopeptide repeat protein, partial [Gemmatimonadota bacterium]|nr:tetratricopeptide repeat protein [Gemmatimonadota bacterium]
ALQCVLCCVAVPVFAQKSDRDSAFALGDGGKFFEAIPLLEKLVAAGSTDRAVYERLGLAILKTSGMNADAEVRRQQRIRARAMFEKAAQLGSKSDQILALLNAIPADGGPDASFSRNAEVDAVMKKAETAYSSSDYKLAFKYYQEALALDSTLYDAALFSGDTYLHTPTADSAYVWYARAARINPNRETAWRYWSDVLVKNNRLDEARDKAINAMVAEPFNRIARQALASWAPKARIPVAFPRVDFPVVDTASVHSRARVAYDSVRAVWRGTDPKGGALFTAAYPAESKYRHTLAEEKAALQAAYRAAGDDGGTANLKKLDDAGELEAYIFFARADQQIASEYDAYRRTHSDALRNFWSDFVIGAPYAR